jgi:hypothetical protein
MCMTGMRGTSRAHSAAGQTLTWARGPVQTPRPRPRPTSVRSPPSSAQPFVPKKKKKPPTLWPGLNCPLFSESPPGGVRALPMESPICSHGRSRGLVLQKGLRSGAVRSGVLCPWFPSESQRSSGCVSGSVCHSPVSVIQTSYCSWYVPACAYTGRHKHLCI